MAPPPPSYEAPARFHADLLWALRWLAAPALGLGLAMSSFDLIGRGAG